MLPRNKPPSLSPRKPAASQARVTAVGDRRIIMSGRPRTTSFAESCKPVPQPSAFGSMKVSSKYPPPSQPEPLPT